MAHSHWEGGPTCRFRTLKACDEWVTWFNHGHYGRPCIKQQQESKSKRGRMNKVATCILIEHPEHGESFMQGLARQRALYNEQTPDNGRT